MGRPWYDRAELISVPLPLPPSPDLVAAVGTDIETPPNLLTQHQFCRGGTKVGLDIFDLRLPFFTGGSEAFTFGGFDL